MLAQQVTTAPFDITPLANVVRLFLGAAHPLIAGEIPGADVLTAFDIPDAHAWSDALEKLRVAGVMRDGLGVLCLHVGALKEITLDGVEPWLRRKLRGTSGVQEVVAQQPSAIFLGRALALLLDERGPMVLSDFNEADLAEHGLTRVELGIALRELVALDVVSIEKDAYLLRPWTRSPLISRGPTDCLKEWLSAGVKVAPALKQIEQHAWYALNGGKAFRVVGFHGFGQADRATLEGFGEVHVDTMLAAGSGWQRVNAPTSPTVAAPDDYPSRLRRFGGECQVINEVRAALEIAEGVNVIERAAELRLDHELQGAVLAAVRKALRIEAGVGVAVAAGELRREHDRRGVATRALSDMLVAMCTALRIGDGADIVARCGELREELDSARAALGAANAIAELRARAEKAEEQGAIARADLNDALEVLIAIRGAAGVGKGDSLVVAVRELRARCEAAEAKIAALSTAGEG
jgi:hypothetical protein